MSTTRKRGDSPGQRKPGKLRINKETLKDLTSPRSGKIKGGAPRITDDPNDCGSGGMGCNSL